MTSQENIDYTLKTSIVKSTNYYRFMQEKQQQILTQAIELAPFDGWSAKTLRHAAKNAGLDENYAQICFKAGPVDAISLFFSKIDQKTYSVVDANTSENLTSMKVRERIFHILDTRFAVMEKYKPAIRKTVQFLAMPQNLVSGGKLLWEMADNAWYKAGDKSADFNYYTKRTTLMAVYSSSLLFWLNDDSENHSATQDFLKHRIENILQFENVKGKITEILASRKAS